MYFLLSIVISFAILPSIVFAQSSRVTSIVPSSPSSSGSSTTTNHTSSTTSFANLTTTNAQGSTIITSIPITISLSTTPTATSSAPFPSLTGYPPCVTDCLTHAVAQVNCTSITAVSCFCPNRIFPGALYTCVVANCSASVPSAENLAQQFCALDNTTLSFSSTAAPSTTPSTSTLPGTTSTTITSSSSAPSNAALSMFWTFGTPGWSAIAVAACGAVFGAAML